MVDLGGMVKLDLLTVCVWSLYSIDHVHDGLNSEIFVSLMKILRFACIKHLKLYWGVCEGGVIDLNQLVTQTFQKPL